MTTLSLLINLSFGTEFGKVRNQIIFLNLISQNLHENSIVPRGRGSMGYPVRGSTGYTILFVTE